MEDYFAGLLQRMVWWTLVAIIGIALAALMLAPIILSIFAGWYFMSLYLIWAIIILLLARKQDEKDEEDKQ